MRLDLLALLNAERAARRAAILVTDLDSGDQRLVREAEIDGDPLAEPLADKLRLGKSGIVESEGGSAFLNVQVPPLKLVAIGAVHISQALAPMARTLDLDMTVIDPRTAFATPERFPEVPVLAEWPDAALPTVGLDRYTALAALTHDPKIDDPALAAALRAGCFYIGALGSRKTHARRVERLAAQGFTEVEIARIAAPIGLDIGAVSPSEIALSILAEIVAELRRDRLARRMIFGPVAVAEAVGAIAAHTVRAGDAVVKKGSVISAADVERLGAAGIATVVAVRLEPDDVGENEAALRLAEAIAGPRVAVERPFTGRSNLFAKVAGLLVVDRASIDRVNGVDESITAATLAAFKPVVAGEMVGTVKIIPYAVPAPLLAAAVAAGAGGGLRVAPYTRRKVGVVSTLMPGLKPSVVEKTLAVLHRRLEPAGAVVAGERRVAHETAALTQALVDEAKGPSDLVVVFGASAIADRRDVIPAALEAAGGTVAHFGMPVDPGNLLLVGEIAGKPVIGAPGCARSPKENGFDWILQRLLAGLPVSRADIVGLGVGGLLMEIVSRPQPRAGAASAEE